MYKIKGLWGLIPILTATFPLSATNQPSIGQIGFTKICELKDDKKAAYTFTTDDGMLSAIQYYNQEFKRLRLCGSMALITSRLDGVETEFKEIINDGCFDVTNHSMNHPRFSEINERSKLENEINGSQRLLQSKFPGQDVITMANPYVNNTDLADSVIKENHYAARNGSVGFNSLRPSSYNWYHLNFRATYNYSLSQPYTADYLNDGVKTAIADGKWLIILAHGLGTGQNSIPKTEISAHFEYVAAHLDSIWCGTFNEVTKYLREKQNSVVTIEKSGSTKIIVNLVHCLNSQLFNFPLTLQTVIPNNWKRVSCQQGGKMQSLNIVKKDGLSYVCYDVIPNNKHAVLTGF